MSEINFRVFAFPDGGFLARAVGADIFTEAETLCLLQGRIRDAVYCHFDAGAPPQLIRLTIEPGRFEDDDLWVE